MKKQQTMTTHIEESRFDKKANEDFFRRITKPELSIYKPAAATGPQGQKGGSKN